MDFRAKFVGCGTFWFSLINKMDLVRDFYVCTLMDALKNTWYMGRDLSMYVYTYIYIYTYIHIHTHIHIQTNVYITNVYHNIKDNSKWFTLCSLTCNSFISLRIKHPVSFISLE